MKKNKFENSIDLSKTNIDQQSKIKYEENQKKDNLKNNIQRTSSIEVNTATKNVVVNKKNINNKIYFSKQSFMKNDFIIDAKNKIQNSLNSQNDMGSQTLSSIIDATTYSHKTFNVAQKISPIAINSVTKTAKGVYTVGNKTIKVANLIGKTAYDIKSGKIILNKELMNNLKSQSFKKVIYSKPVQRIISSVNNVKTKVDKTIRYGIKIKNNTIKTVRITTGILTGSTKIKINKNTLNSIKGLGVKGIKLTGKTIGYGIKTGTISSIKMGKWTGIKSIKAFNAGSLTLSNSLETSDDTGIQALSLGIKSGHFSKKIIKTTPKVFGSTYKGVKTGIVSSYRTGKAIFSIINRFRKFGIKDTVKFYNSKMIKAIKKAGSSAISAFSKFTVDLLKKIGIKFLVPLMVIIIVVVGVNGAVSAITSGVSAVFGGIFSIFSTDDTGAKKLTDYETHKYILDKIVPLKSDFVAKIEKMRDDNLVQNGGNYHYIRLFTETSEEEIDISSSSIYSVIYTDDQLSNLIEPMFTTIVLTKYDLMPTEEQAKDLIQEIFDTLINVETKELPVEYCNTACSDCGKIHADISTCPNMETGTHGSYTCSSCCYKYCNGHPWSNPKTGQSGISYCSGCKDGCNGYHYCKGHKILGITITLDGFHELTAKYFTDEIDALANKQSRTEEEEIKLQNLKDGYEMCLNQMEVIMELYGSGLSSSDISNVQFINGSRPANDTLINLAKMQVGNIGGKPFWSWYGFTSRVEWCACFVSWNLDQLGYIDKGIVPKYSYCPTGAKWFKDNGLWASGNYQNPVAGDIIFFDWQGNGTTDHTGFVIGHDGSFVYTVEGNSGDTCRIKKYSLNSNVIYGYGLPNYK